MKNFKDYILPLGSVVTCKFIKEKYRKNSYFVITNRIIQASENSTKYFEYEGYFYPGGTQKNERLKFNHSDIDTIIHTGYRDNKDIDFLDGLHKFVIESGLKIKKLDYL